MRVLVSGVSLSCACKRYLPAARMQLSDTKLFLLSIPWQIIEGVSVAYDTKMESGDSRRTAFRLKTEEGLK